MDKDSLQEESDEKNFDKKTTRWSKKYLNERQNQYIY
jgi:hypothetical protein